MAILDFETGKTIVGVLQRGSRGQTYQRMLFGVTKQAQNGNRYIYNF